jgi:hypothetical protein
VDFTDEQLAQMRTDLGLPDDADQAAIVSKLTEVTATDDAGTDDAPAAPVNGTVTVDSETWASLKSQAALGEAAHARQAQEDRERLVSAAVDDGRIPPARREHWLKQLTADPGAAASLAALEPGLIPVGAPAGHSGSASDDADPLYTAVFGKEGN